MIMMLLAFGLIMVFSASSPMAHYKDQGAAYYFKRQLMFAVVGVAVMMMTSSFNYKMWYKLYIVFGVVTLGLLFAVPLVGTVAGGAKRWIKVGPVQIQPSEIAKVAVVIVMSRLLTDYGYNIEKYFKGFCLMMLVPAVTAVIVLSEHHLSGAIIIVLAGVVLVFVAGAKLSHIILSGLVVGVPAAAYAVIKEPYRLVRVLNFVNPFNDARGAGYQAVQSLYAIGSGGLFGVGLGQSREKYLYLPEAHTDFIFSVTCEELGFVGAMLVIVMFVILIVTGIITLIALQVIFNIAVVTSAMPCTGITLPFFSYGGSSLLINLFEMGIVLNVSRYSGRKI